MANAEPQTGRQPTATPAAPAQQKTMAEIAAKEEALRLASRRTLNPRLLSSRVTPPMQHPGGRHLPAYHHYQVEGEVGRYFDAEGFFIEGSEQPLPPPPPPPKIALTGHELELARMKHEIAALKAQVNGEPPPPFQPFREVTFKASPSEVQMWDVMHWQDWARSNQPPPIDWTQFSQMATQFTQGRKARDPVQLRQLLLNAIESLPGSRPRQMQAWNN